MRFSSDGDPEEVENVFGRALQEMHLLQARMSALGLEQGSFTRRLSPNAVAIGNILPTGMRTLRIVADPSTSESTTGLPLRYFEFATSGWPVQTWDGSSAGTSFTAYKGCVIGINLVAKDDGSIAARARVNTEQRQLHLALASRVGREFQVQLCNEPVAYTGRFGSATRVKYHDTVYTTYAPTSPYTGIYVTSANFEAPRLVRSEAGSERAFSARDVGFDVPFQLGRDAGKVAFAVLREDADWPRATCVQTVRSDAHGPRRFAIYIDGAGKLFVFPVAAITRPSPTLEQNVPPSAVRSAAIPFPAWAFVPSGKAMDLYADPVDWFANNPDLEWQFNHLGTRACCVLHEREAAVWDDAYLSDPDTHWNPLYSRDKADYIGKTGLQQRFLPGTTNEAVSEIYTYGRGVFEIAIHIDVTGPGLGEFAINVTGTEVRTPRGSNRGTFLAGYAWHDIPLRNIVAGDMLLLDIERWYEPDAAIAEPASAAGNWRLTIIDKSTAVWTATADWVAGPGSLPDWLLDNFPDEGPDPFNFRQKNGENTLLVTGRGLSFFALRRRRSNTETDVLAINGDALLAYDLKTASFAVAIEHETLVDREVPASNDPLPTPDGWPEVATMPHRISHPGVAIYTMGERRTVLLPTGASGAVNAALQEKAAVDPRAVVSGWTYLAANDLRDWSGMPDLRDVLLYANDLADDWPERLPTTPSYPIGTLSVPERNWWLAGMCVASSNSVLLMMSNPNFGWAAYTSEVINRSQHSPNVTFFAHPGGSWAFYDDARIYNTFGIPDVVAPASDLQTNGAGRYLHSRGGNPEGAYPVPVPYWALVADFGTGGFISGLQLEQLDDLAPMAFMQLRKFAFDNAGPSALTQASDPIDFAPFGSGHAQRYRLVNVWNDYDTLTPSLGAASAFKHQVFDHIHLALQGARGAATLDTSFREQYNAARARLAAKGVETDLEPLALSDLHAKFTLAAEGNTGLTLSVEWPAGTTHALTDRAFKSHNFNPVKVLLTLSSQSGTLLKPRLTDVFDGERITGVMPPTFSTCLLLDL